MSINETYNSLSSKSSFEELLKLSYSRLSDFDKNGPQCLIKRSKISGEGVSIGSITDDWLFERDKFFDKYFEATAPKPTASSLVLYEALKAKYETYPTVEEIIETAKENKLWSAAKDEAALLKRFDKPDFWAYLNESYDSADKTVVSTEELMLGQELAAILQSHPNSNYIFDSSCENLYQVEVEYTYRGVILRGFLDIVRINHDNKTIRFIDLKTGAPNTEEFLQSFIKHRYYLQAAVYTKAFDWLCKELNLVGYSLLPFQFLYISRYQKIPEVHTITDKWLNGALHGFKLNGKYKRKGLNELIDEAVWHFSNNIFECSKQTFEAKGQQVLIDDLIEVEYEEEQI